MNGTTGTTGTTGNFTEALFEAITDCAGSEDGQVIYWALALAALFILSEGLALVPNDRIRSSSLSELFAQAYKHVRFYIRQQRHLEEPTVRDFPRSVGGTPV